MRTWSARKPLSEEVFSVMRPALNRGVAWQRTDGLAAMERALDRNISDPSLLLWARKAFDLIPVCLFRHTERLHSTTGQANDPVIKQDTPMTDEL